MSQSGYIINDKSPLPLRSTFLAKRSSSLLAVTGNGIRVKIIYDQEIDDRQGDYDNTTGDYTAPQDGKYIVSHSIDARNLMANNTSGDIDIFTTQFNYFFWRSNFALMRDSGGILETNSTIILPMDSGDEANSQVVVRNGSQLVNIFGTTTGTPESVHTSFGAWNLG